MDALLFALMYFTAGVALLCYDVATCDGCLNDLRCHGWLLVAIMTLGWPIFLAMALYARLTDR